MEPAQSRPAGSLTGLPAAAGLELGELLQRTALGDRDAFTTLYDALASRVHGLSVRIVRDRAQAEEVTQEAFLEVWRSAARFDPARGSALAWVLTIAHGKAVDRVRSAEASSRRESTYQRRASPEPYDATAEAAQAGLEARQVRLALHTLSPVQREAIELAYFRGLTHTEVAAELGLPLGTAKTRIRDGLIRLRDTIGAEA